MPLECPLAEELPSDSRPAPREALAGKDRRTLAREPLGMSQETFSRGFKASPMKRAKLRGLGRNAAAALGNVGTTDEAAVLTRAPDDTAPLVREHAAQAVERIATRTQASSAR